MGRWKKLTFKNLIFGNLWGPEVVGSSSYQKNIGAELSHCVNRSLWSATTLATLTYLFSTFLYFFYRRGHRRNASEYLPDSAHYRAGYSYQDRENRFQDAAPRNYDLQQGSSASQPSGGPPRYTSNPNLAAAPDVNPEYERPPPYYYPGAAPAGGASGPGPSGAGPSNVPPPLPMPNNRS